mmetsp:Transcript_126047/g.362564  ORF Transcript_126047/g.362564 Transcript_126047/m.362564 type:complete len:214 (-) Transcript_126047:699-1340(-)
MQDLARAQGLVPRHLEHPRLHLGVPRNSGLSHLVAGGHGGPDPLVHRLPRLPRDQIGEAREDVRFGSGVVVLGRRHHELRQGRGLGGLRRPLALVRLRRRRHLRDRPERRRLQHRPLLRRRGVALQGLLRHCVQVDVHLVTGHDPGLLVRQHREARHLPPAFDGCLFRGLHLRDGLWPHERLGRRHRREHPPGRCYLRRQDRGDEGRGAERGR